jgi:hypothetical protein
MPKRHLLPKKSRSRRSSTSTQSNRTKPKNQRTAQKKRGRKSSAAKPSQPTRTSPRLALGKTVIADMLGDPSLSFSAAARKWKVDRRWLREHFGSELQKDSSGRIRAKVRNRRHRTLYKPTASPGESIPVVTKSKRERHLLGTWMAALNAASRGHWSKMKKFPRNVVIGGVRLETSPDEVQEILNALAEEESPFEGLYRTIVRPS